MIYRTVVAGECRVDVVGNPLPPVPDLERVALLHVAVLVQTPVKSVPEEVHLVVLAPDEGRVQLGEVDGETEVAQGARRLLDEVVAVKHPIPGAFNTKSNVADKLYV